MGYRIEVRDRNLKRIGEIDTWQKLDFVVRFNDTGTWQLLIKDGTPQAQLLDRGGGVVIWQDGVSKPVLTGQIESFQKYWTVEQHTGPGSIYVGGKCDNKLAFQRVAFPDPSKPVAQQYTAPESRTVKRKMGDAIWYELSTSLGPGAVADRQIAGLSLGTSPGIGPTINDNLRYDSIGSKIGEWTDTKEVGYRLVYNPDTELIELDIYKPQDRSKEIRFSRDLGNLREIIYTLTAPTVTRAIVACQGEGSERYVYQKIDEAAEAEWGISIETFVDRRDLPLKTGANGQPIKANSQVTDEDFETAKAAVIEAADTALKEGEGNGNFQIYPIDTPQLAFGRDYFVGDIVTVSMDDTEYSDIVREVAITVEDGGAVHSVAPKIGEQGSGEPLNLYKTVFEMREKLRKLERRM